MVDFEASSIDDVDVDEARIKKLSDQRRHRQIKRGQDSRSLQLHTDIAVLRAVCSLYSSLPLYVDMYNKYDISRLGYSTAPQTRTR